MFIGGMLGGANFDHFHPATSALVPTCSDWEFKGTLRDVGAFYGSTLQKWYLFPWSMLYVQHVSTLLASQTIFFKGGSSMNSTTNQPFVAWCRNRPPNPRSFQVWRSGREEAIRPSGHFLQKRVEKDHMDHESRWFADLPIFSEGYFFTAILDYQRVDVVFFLGLGMHEWKNHRGWWQLLQHAHKTRDNNIDVAIQSPDYHEVFFHVLSRKWR